MTISNNRSLSRLAAVQMLFHNDFNEKMNLERLKPIKDLDTSEIYETIQNFNNGIKEYDGLQLEKDWFLKLVNSVFNNKKK